MFGNVLDEPRRLLPNKIVEAPPLPHAYLAGNRPRAVVRTSEFRGFRLFTPEDFNPYEVSSALERTIGNVKIDSTSPGIFHGHIDGVRLTWLHYPKSKSPD